MKIYSQSVKELKNIVTKGLHLQMPTSNLMILDGTCIYNNLKHQEDQMMSFSNNHLPTILALQKERIRSKTLLWSLLEPQIGKFGLQVPLLTPRNQNKPLYIRGLGI
jgi:hypothetical protein